MIRADDGSDRQRRRDCRTGRRNRGPWFQRPVVCHQRPRTAACRDRERCGSLVRSPTRLGVEVGDAVTLRHPTGTWTVAGTGRVQSNFDKLAVVMPDLPVEQFVDGVFDRVTLIDLPADASAADIAAAGRGLGEIVERPLDDLRFDPRVSWRGQQGGADSHREALAWGWVAGAIALAATGIIISAAFATSARRQLVTVGQLSANGAPERLVRRSLALQGGWTGLVGSVVGLIAAVVALLHRQVDNRRGQGFGARSVPLRPVRSRRDSHDWDFGRHHRRPRSRPLGESCAGAHGPRWPASARRRAAATRPVVWPLFALGVFLLFLGASSDGGGDAAAAAAVLGGVMILAGMCCCSPLAIETMSRASARIGRSWRFAGRSLGRTRTRECRSGHGDRRDRGARRSSVDVCDEHRVG